MHLSPLYFPACLLHNILQLLIPASSFWFNPTFWWDWTLPIGNWDYCLTREVFQNVPLWKYDRNVFLILVSCLKMYVEIMNLKDKNDFWTWSMLGTPYKTLNLIQILYQNEWKILSALKSYNRDFFFFVFFRALMAHGNPQARGSIKAVAAGLYHNHRTVGSELNRVCDLYHSSWQHQILNPLSEAMDRTCNLMDPSRVH